MMSPSPKEAKPRRHDIYLGRCVVGDLDGDVEAGVLPLESVAVA